MINPSNGMISTSSAAANAQSPGLKTYFKTPEGRYKLHYEKTHPSGLLHYAHGKTVTQVTIANLKDKPAPSTPPAPPSSFSASSGVRSAAARLLGAGNGSRALGFVGGNGGSKSLSGSSRIGSLGASSSSSSMINTNFDGKGTYIIFNVGDAIFISDLNSQDKDPIKSIHFSNSNPVCHAFDQDAKDGHDLLIGLNSGDVYSVSLRQQLQDVGKKLVGAHHYNKDGSVNNGLLLIVVVLVLHGFPEVMVLLLLLMPMVICMCMKRQALNIKRNTFFSKDGAGDSSFPVIKDQTQFSVAHARYSKMFGSGYCCSNFDEVDLIIVLIESNPIARWHICQGPINSIAFSTDGTHLATVIYEFSTIQKNNLFAVEKAIMVRYYVVLGGVFDNKVPVNSMDGKYILTGGEDDLVQVWSMEDRKVVAWGEGHNSWVSGVAFDSYWSSPNSDGTGETVMYRFGSVGQSFNSEMNAYSAIVIYWLLELWGMLGLNRVRDSGQVLPEHYLMMSANDYDAIFNMCQDTRLLLWDLEMDEIVVPFRRGPPGGSPTFSTGSQSAHWDNVPVGTLQPAPSMRDVPKLSPLVAHRIHTEPLSGVIFTQESVLTVCREGHIKIWMRPGFAESQSGNNSETLLSTSSKEKPLLSSKVGSSSYRQ
ncbi:hypothetical protein EZV62_016345 [Acer yangbiense]|uniref:Uncharacterized protein n=1 Tax=Acer yangbiense TaxID=1000413 RepID=A0A5C7HQB2_9ROSI|nr:hypothetical protein EZV62_016345 [Acer yangbiense]